MVGYWCPVGSLALTHTHNDVAILVQWRTLLSIFLLWLLFSVLERCGSFTFSFQGQFDDCAPCSSVCSKEYQGRASSKFQVVNVPCALRSSRQRMIPRLAGQVPDPAADAWSYVITVCTGFVFKYSDNAAAKFALQGLGPIYTWITNPTLEALVKKIAALEGGSAAVAVSYGHAAQLLAFSNILQPGDHFIATDKIYGGTYTQLGRQFNSLVGRSRSAASKTLWVDTAVPTRFAMKLPLRVWFVLCVMFSRLFCAVLLLAFGQDVQFCMVAVQTSGSPCSLERGGGQALVRVFGSVNPVNVDLVKPICEGFGCSRRCGRRRRGGRRLRF